MFSRLHSVGVSIFAKYKCRKLFIWIREIFGKKSWINWLKTFDRGPHSLWVNLIATFHYRHFLTTNTSLVNFVFFSRTWRHFNLMLVLFSIRGRHLKLALHFFSISLPIVHSQYWIQLFASGGAGLQNWVRYFERLCWLFLQNLVSRYISAWCKENKNKT